MNTDSPFIAHHRASDGISQPLSEHLFSVAKRAGQFAAKIGLGPQGELIGLLHDLGKHSSEFQTYLKSATGLLDQDDDEEFVGACGLKGKVDHSTAGAQLLWSTMLEQGKLGRIVGQALALCVASHHSGLINCLTSDIGSLGEDAFAKRMSKKSDLTHLDEALAKAEGRFHDRWQELLAGSEVVTGLKDLMANIVRAAPLKDDKSVVAQVQFGFVIRFLLSCLIDADRIDTADFEKPNAGTRRMHGRYTEWNVLISRLDEYLGQLDSRNPIDSLRENISAHCRDSASRSRGIYCLTVPTGGGKTLSSLRFALHHAAAHSMDRVIYFIPYTSIIDQNAKRVREILEPQGTPQGTVVLEHHSNLTPEKQTWRGKILAEDWDAPVVFTTNVQFLESFFGGGTRGARRLHQMANAVLIFDEIQTLPVRCVHLFNNAINFLVEQCGCTAVLCTATQPLLDEVDERKGAIRTTSRSELIPDVKTLFAKLRRVEVINRRKPGGWTNDETATLALDEAKELGSCLVVVNTKQAARTQYRLIKGQSESATFHLSTNMCPAHRRNVLREIEDRLSHDGTEPVICVSTQLIEAGVDVDFGAVVRFAAGLDSVAQAAGRCNRNACRPTGRVHVVNPQGEPLDRLLEIRVGRDIAERVLDDYQENPGRFGDDPIGPEAMRWYYQNYFFSRSNSMDYPVSSQALGHDDTLLNLLSVNSIAVAEFGKRHGRAPGSYFRQSFMTAAKSFTAIDAPTRGVVVPYGKAGRSTIGEICSATDPASLCSLLRRAQELTVNVFPQPLERLLNAGAVHSIVATGEILALAEQYYSPEFGLSETPLKNMEVLYA